MNKQLTPKQVDALDKEIMLKLDLIEALKEDIRELTSLYLNSEHIEDKRVELKLIKGGR
jgi:hypothetical protein